jgi:hypothetical protein
MILRSKEIVPGEQWLHRAPGWRIGADHGILTWQRMPEQEYRAHHEFSEFRGLLRAAADGLSVQLSVHAGRRLIWTGQRLQLSRGGGIQGECSVWCDGAEIAAFMRGRLFAQGAVLMVSVTSRFHPAWSGTCESDRAHVRLHLTSDLRAVREE